MTSLSLLHRSLYFQRDDWLYRATLGGNGALQTPHRLGKLPSGLSDYDTARWAVSRDEKYLAFLTDSESVEGASGKTEPLRSWGVHTAALPDLNKCRPLFQVAFSDDDKRIRQAARKNPFLLRAANGSPVTDYASGDTGDSLKGFAGDGAPVFASNGRTLFLSL